MIEVLQPLDEHLLSPGVSFIRSGAGILPTTGGAMPETGSTSALRQNVWNCILDETLQVLLPLLLIHVCLI